MICPRCHPRVSLETSVKIILVTKMHLLADPARDLQGVFLYGGNALAVQTPLPYTPPHIKICELTVFSDMAIVGKLVERDRIANIIQNILLRKL